MLEASASAALCEQILTELKTIASPDDAAIWAHRKLAAKNSLTASDARRGSTDRGQHASVTEGQAKEQIHCNYTVA